jgi:hypothetical protein
VSKPSSLSAVLAKKGEASAPADASGRITPPPASALAQETLSEPAPVKTDVSVEAVSAPLPLPVSADLQPARMAKPAVARKQPPTARVKAPETQAASAQAPTRKQPWDGQDDIVKANYEVPRRVQTKLHLLKTYGRLKNIKSFVAEALEAALDKELAEYAKGEGT